MLYEIIQQEAAQRRIYIYEHPLPLTIKGLQIDNVVRINRDLETYADKVCIVVEEIGHIETTAGDILDQKNVGNRKQELRARQWGYYYLLPLSKIVQAWAAGVNNIYEFAEFVGVTEEWLEEALERYRQIYGLHTTWEGHKITFEPLNVIEL